MKKLYNKSQLGFFILWIGIYILLQNLGYSLSDKIGTAWSATAALNLAMALFLYGWIRKQGLLEYYGLCRLKVPAAAMLWFLPLIVLSTGNLWNGTAAALPVWDTVFYLVCMGCVGFLEEILVRGFLFQYLKKESVKQAVVISTVSFSVAHILNLFSKGGMEVADNLFQIAGALCVGFLYAVILLRGKSLWPCILSHCAINMLSVFARREGLTLERRLLHSGTEMAIMLIYAAILIHKAPKPDAIRE